MSVDLGIVMIGLTDGRVIDLIPCEQHVGLCGLQGPGQADDLIGLLYLGQCYLGYGRQVLQAGVVEGVCRVAGEGGSYLGTNEEQVFQGICFIFFCSKQLSNVYILGSDLVDVG